MQRDMSTEMRKASVLVDALPYLRDFNQKVIVIGYLCNDLLSPAQEQLIMHDITTLQSVGMKMVIVHNTRMGADKFHENKRLAKLIEFCGVKAIGICGIDEQTLHMTLENNYIPVIMPNDIDNEHEVIHPADTALEVAKLLNAEKLIFLTGSNGINLEDGTHVYSMTLSQLEEYRSQAKPAPATNSAPISEVMLNGLMVGLFPDYMGPSLQSEIDKLLDNSAAAVRAGIPRSHILDGQIPHALLLELFGKVGVGTVIKDNENSFYPHEK